MTPVNIKLRPDTKIFYNRCVAKVGAVQIGLIEDRFVRDATCGVFEHIEDELMENEIMRHRL